jgi:hypothetical protein
VHYPVTTPNIALARVRDRRMLVARPMATARVGLLPERLRFSVGVRRAGSYPLEGPCWSRCVRRRGIDRRGVSVEHLFGEGDGGFDRHVANSRIEFGATCRVEMVGSSWRACAAGGPDALELGAQKVGLFGFVVFDEDGDGSSIVAARSQLSRRWASSMNVRTSLATSLASRAPLAAAWASARRA